MLGLADAQPWLRPLRYYSNLLNFLLQLMWWWGFFLHENLHVEAL